MIKLLIADDEYLVIDSIKYIIEKYVEGVEIIGMASTGRNYSIENFMRSYNEAYMAASMSESDAITHFEDIAVSIGSSDPYPIGKEKLLLHRMLAGDETGALEVFEELYLWLTSNYREDIDRIKSKLIELLFVLQRSIPYSLEDNGVFGQEYLTGILKIQNTAELKLSYLNYIKSIMHYIGENRKNELSGLITKVLKYIGGNYHKDISLDDAAKEINLSYHYFSKLFKESVGKSFVDYLTELRIEKSKELLKDPNISIKEICYSTGYSDPNYYCKIFKKLTGMTPTEYRAGINIGNQFL